MMSKSAIDRLTGHVQSHASVTHGEWAELLDGLRASAAKQRKSIEHGRRLAKPDGDELKYIDMAEEFLLTVEADIESCNGPATAIRIVDALTFVALNLGLAAGTRGGVTRRARNARKKGHEDSEQDKAKAKVKVWWKKWRSGEVEYKLKKDFYAAMLDKFDGILLSADVIGRWVREWDKEAAATVEK